MSNSRRTVRLVCRTIWPPRHGVGVSSEDFNTQRQFWIGNMLLQTSPTIGPAGLEGSEEAGQRIVRPLSYLWFWVSAGSCCHEYHYGYLILQPSPSCSPSPMLEGLPLGHQRVLVLRRSSSHYEEYNFVELMQRHIQLTLYRETRPSCLLMESEVSRDRAKTACRAGLDFSYSLLSSTIILLSVS
jgi:hypothetical protein